MREKIKRKFPRLAIAVRFLRNHVQGLPLIFASKRKIFEKYYHTNYWEDPGSRSGPGSSLSQTEQIREAIPRIVQEFGVKSMLDIPCGDFHWMKEMDLELDQYIGADIVEAMIKENTNRHGSESRKFVYKDILRDNLPRVDLILCRDLLIHFSLADIKKAIDAIKKSGSSYLLTTTFTDTHVNEHIISGQFRPINLQRPPFNFPAPLVLVLEKCTERDGYLKDKSLGLWRIADL